MDEQRQGRRRRGRRGGQARQRDEQQQRPQGTPPGPPGPPDATPPARAQGGGEEQPRRRQDTRRDRRGTPAPPPREGGSRIHRRAPDERPQPEARERGGRSREGRPRDGRGRDGERSARSFEPPVPQDARSIELGAAFREAQNALRDARKTLEKRKAEHGDEPEWLLAEYRATEERFAAAATAWHEHLSQTGRKVVRR